MDVSLEYLNGLDKKKCSEILSACCGSSNWLNQMMDLRPFTSLEDLISKANKSWSKCDINDGLEAFNHHPEIGKRKEQSANDQSNSWSRVEQKKVAVASNEVLERLDAGNAAYLQKFGYRFIVFASGKSAPEMLKILSTRLAVDPENEIVTAMSELHKITLHRLEKLIT